jgi:hypothetical protein
VSATRAAPAGCAAKIAVLLQKWHRGPGDHCLPDCDPSNSSTASQACDLPPTLCDPRDTAIMSQHPAAPSLTVAPATPPPGARRQLPRRAWPLERVSCWMPTGSRATSCLPHAAKQPQAKPARARAILWCGARARLRCASCSRARGSCNCHTAAAARGSKWHPGSQNSVHAPGWFAPGQRASPNQMPSPSCRRWPLPLAPPGCRLGGHQTHTPLTAQSPDGPTRSGTQRRAPDGSSRCAAATQAPQNCHRELLVTTSGGATPIQPVMATAAGWQVARTMRHGRSGQQQLHAPAEALVCGRNRGAQQPPPGAATFTTSAVRPVSQAACCASGYATQAHSDTQQTRCCGPAEAAAATHARCEPRARLQPEPCNPVAPAPGLSGLPAHAAGVMAPRDPTARGHNQHNRCVHHHKHHHILSHICCPAAISSVRHQCRPYHNTHQHPHTQQHPHLS